MRLALRTKLVKYTVKSQRFKPAGGWSYFNVDLQAWLILLNSQTHTNSHQHLKTSLISMKSLSLPSSVLHHPPPCSLLLPLSFFLPLDKVLHVSLSTHMQCVPIKQLCQEASCAVHCSLVPGLAHTTQTKAKPNEWANLKMTNTLKCWH